MLFIVLYKTLNNKWYLKYIYFRVIVAISIWLYIFILSEKAFLILSIVLTDFLHSIREKGVYFIVPFMRNTKVLSSLNDCQVTLCGSYKKPLEKNLELNHQLLHCTLEQVLC